MPGGEEIDGLVFHCLFAIERADVARPAGDSRQTVDQRPVAELDREDPVASRALDGEPQADACRDHDLLVERVELRGDAREDACGHVGSVRVAMELLVGRFADARARRVGVADQGRRIVLRRAMPTDRARSLRGHLRRGPVAAPARPAARGRGLASRRAARHHEPIPEGGRK